jgi:hypothetical protein
MSHLFSNLSDRIDKEKNLIILLVNLGKCKNPLFYLKWNGIILLRIIIATINNYEYQK